MTGTIDYQIAEGELVATRWQWYFEPNVWWMKLLGGKQHIPIINVFRFRDGKIVEIWNHRHDIDTMQSNVIFLKGLLVGLLPAVVIGVVLLISWLRKRRRGSPSQTSEPNAAAVLILILFVSAMLSGSTVAQSTSFTSPRLLTVPKFVPPASARGLTGALSVNVAVDSRGRVTNVISVAGPGDICAGVTRQDVVDVRTVASNTAMRATFAPATLGGLTQASEAWVDFELPAPKEMKQSKSGKEDPTVAAAGEMNYSANSSDPSSEQGNAKQLVGGVLNGKAMMLPKPPYPPAARAVRASGAVQIQVLIETDGSVFSARAVSGHPLLRAQSAIAACKAKFTPTLLSGQPVKVSGIIIYNYVP
jgi:outer membrane biosynthesis protein TonB